MTERYAMRHANRNIAQAPTANSNGCDENKQMSKNLIIAPLKEAKNASQPTVTESHDNPDIQDQQANVGRNALGDIGNKLNKLNAAVIVNTKKPSVKLDSNVNKKVVIPIKSNNHTASMIEIESSSDEEIVDDDDDVQIESISNELPSDVDDIDADDVENTQLVAEYVKDIYYYLYYLEKRFKISSTFLNEKIVTSKMRAVLIDWLLQVHMKFHLLHETLYLCVQIIDAYLEAVNVTKMQLQLVGVSAMFVACKYEEMYVPAIEDFVYMTDNTYTKSEIRQMEISILKTMNFMFSKPLPLHFLRRFSKAGRADPKQHTLAKYFMEITLHDADFSSFDPSYLAACSLCLSFRLLGHGEDKDQSSWSKQLEFYSTYNQEYLIGGMQKIAKLVLKASDVEYKYRAATNKYSSSKFFRISMLPELSSSFMKELALNGKFA